MANTLLRVAEKGLYRPLWSDRILAEAQADTETFGHSGLDLCTPMFAPCLHVSPDPAIRGLSKMAL